MSLQITQEGEKLQVTLVKSTILRDEEGAPMTGLIPTKAGAHHPKMEDGRTSIDPEAIALAEDGTIYLSDEYGPYHLSIRARRKNDPAHRVSRYVHTCHGKG